MKKLLAILAAFVTGGLVVAINDIMSVSAINCTESFCPAMSSN